MPFGARVDGMTEGVTAGVSPPLASLSEGGVCEADGRSHLILASPV